MLLALRDILIELASCSSALVGGRTRSVSVSSGDFVTLAALYFARMDYEDYQMRINTSALEFIWQSSPSLGAASRSLTGMLYGGYGPISWDYCFDVSVVVRGTVNGFAQFVCGCVWEFR